MTIRPEGFANISRMPTFGLKHASLSSGAKPITSGKARILPFLLRASRAGSNPDQGDLNSLYQLAKLVRRDELAAMAAVAEAYKRAAPSLSPGAEDSQERRIRLIEALFDIFRRSDAPELSHTRPDATKTPGCSTSVRDFIEHQDRTLRIMVFLRYHEDLPISHIARIMGEPESTVLFRLLEFRRSCNHFLCR